MDTEELRVAVYDCFRRGEVPKVRALSAELSVPPAEVAAGLQALASQRQVALRVDGEIAMAHPFTAVPLGFSVMGQDALWWGGCAWDSFALRHRLAGPFGKRARVRDGSADLVAPGFGLVCRSPRARIRAAD